LWGAGSYFIIIGLHNRYFASYLNSYCVLGRWRNQHKVRS